MKYIIASATWMLVTALPAVAQTPPFFGPGTVAYDPEPAVVQSGVVLDARATASADRKYVTITTGVTNSRLSALVQFPVVQTQAQGFVGGAVFPGATASAAMVSPTSPDQLDRAGKSWIFTREGMYLVSPLK